MIFSPNNHSATNWLFRLLFSLLLFLTSCAPYKIPTEHCLVPGNERHQNNQKEALSHPLYGVVPRHRCQIRAFDLPRWAAWMVWGNDDEGIFGEGAGRPYCIYRKNTYGKALSWWCRNPLHNFTHYVIGNAGRVNSELTLLNLHSRGVYCLEYDPIANKNYGSEGTSLFLALHGGKPFVSFRIKYPWDRYTQFYLGWRKNGCFGVKFQPMSRK